MKHPLLFGADAGCAPDALVNANGSYEGGGLLSRVGCDEQEHQERVNGLNRLQSTSLHSRIDRGHEQGGVQ